MVEDERKDFMKIDREQEKKIIQLLNDEEKGLIAYRESENPDTPIYYNDRINIYDSVINTKLNTWDKIKGHIKKLYDKSNSLFFLSHKEDEITGKPQLIDLNQKRIILSMKTKKRIPKSELYTYNFKFLDDNLDKRDREQEEESCSLWFFIYKIVEDKKEYILLSQKELIPDLYRFRGMKITLCDDSEISKTLSFGSLTDIFISVEEEKAIKSLNKGDLIRHIQQLKERYNLDKNKFIDYLFTREDNKIYSHSEDYNKLIISFLLSGKYEYPLHLFILGRVGTGKTYTIEALNNKFNESPGWFASELSTLRGLIPSFREKPAQLGFILNCLRLGLIDELFKLIEKAELTGQSGQYSDILMNYLGSLNSLLEHKEATAGTGNDTIKIKATAKLLFMTNPYKKYKTIYNHIDIIGKTTLSRMIPYVQTEEERAFIDKGDIRINTDKKITQEEFLTIYDSCNSFLIDYEEERVKEIHKKIMNLIKESMKEVWKIRGLHHSILLLDGLVKFRCLFDEDKTFKAQNKDYEELENLLIYIVNSWDCNLIDWKAGDPF